MMHREITFFLLHQALPSSATVAASCGLTSHIFQNLAEPVEPSPGEQNEVTRRFGSQKSFKRMACLLQGKQVRNGFPQKHKVLARLLPSGTDRNASMPTEAPQTPTVQQPVKAALRQPHLRHLFAASENFASARHVFPTNT